VDPVNGFLTIRRTVQDRKMQGRVQAPVGALKSGKGRKVDVPQTRIERLQARRRLMGAEAAITNAEPSPWVFPSATDATKPVDAAFIRFKRGIGCSGSRGSAHSNSTCSGTPTPACCSGTESPQLM